MSLFRRSRPVEDRALTRASVPGAMLPYAAGSGQPIAPDAALRIADAYACIRALSDTAASLPLVAYARTAQGGRERFDGRLADLLERPSPGATTANLVGTIVAHLNLFGNAYLGKYRDARGTVTQVAPLHPAAVTVKLDAGQPRYTRMGAEGVSEHGPEDILHIRGLSVDGLVGLSPIAQARQALGLSQALATHADAFARNSGRPGGILAIKEAAEAAEALDFKQKFAEGFAGENSGRVMVLSGEGIAYQQLALSMSDAEFVGQRQLSTAEIARVFRVPPWMIGAPSGDSLTYSNVEGQAQAFVTFSLAPWLTLIEQAITADADLSPRGVFAEFLLDGLLRADTATRAAVYTAALDPATGWMTRAEVRARENLPPEPGQTPNLGGTPA
ncbi:MAG: phage portal protein [Solirubrobacteraceae bacterium]